MRVLRLIGRMEAIALSFGILAAPASDVIAQSTSNTVPVVVIYATTPNASFAGTPGVFSVFRQGNTVPALNVYYCISGTASNGVDYQTIGNFVSLPSGVVSNSITINPINNGQKNVETVVIDFCPSPALNPVNYAIGSPSNAAVNIYPATNVPPVVRMVNPTNGAVYQAPISISLLAQASDPDGSISNVEFFAGSVDLGRGQEVVLDPPGVNGTTGPVFFLGWTNVSPNTYSITAVATDNGGASTVSVPVNITVLGSISNLPPSVSMLYPTNGATFQAPTSIPMSAAVSFGTYGVPNVEFFAGSIDLGKGVFGIMSGFGGNAYLTWTNPPSGAFSIYAVATYPSSLSLTSTPVNITVLGSGSNQPPVVYMTNPTNGEVFKAPVNIPLSAQASDPDGTVSNLEFFAGTTDLGRGQFVWTDPVLGITFFTLTWSNVPPNAYSLTAVATDNGGASTVSAPVNITVAGAGTNLPPVVRITSPPNGAVYRASLDISIFAYAADPEDNVASVQFFANGNSLGFGRHVVPPPLPIGFLPPVPYRAPTNFWELVWTNPPPGTNIMLTAEATDGGGLSATSAPVEMAILPPLPPPTNRPPFIAIIATDPVAIEGTNCWPWLGLTSPVATWSAWTSSAAVFCFKTNCGPKNATFTVFRVGATNDDINVDYSIGGTATNGVDYVALPGTVLIPAGDRSASIAIVPIDDGPPDITSTVILRVAPGTNYLVGFPPAAAAIILDSNSPRPVTGIAPGHLFHLCAAGPNGAWFHVERSVDLINWTPICTNQVIDGSVDFIDPDAAGQPGFFYRTVSELNAPLQ